MFHKIAWFGQQVNDGRSGGLVSPKSHSSHPASGLKILLETTDITRTLSSGTGRLLPRGSVDKRRLGESLMLKRVSGTRNKRSEPAQNDARHDSGAAIVEMAFIFSILVMLLVGVTTSAIAFGQKNSIENAAREASRYAATLKPMDLGTVLDVARSAAQGDLDGGVDGQYICVAYLSDSGWEKLEETAGVQSGPSAGECYSDGLSDIRVQIVTQRDSEINAALFSIDFTLNAQATARYERIEE